MWTIGGHADDRLHVCQSAPLGIGRKRGEKKQAVGRSRGGRNTKIHALADAKGRLIAILLTGGEAHDCPVAERLIRRVTPAKCMLGDKAYDSNELREDLDERGTQPVIPNRSNRTQFFSLNKRLYKLRWRIEAAVNRPEGLQAHRNAIRQAGTKLSRVRLPCSRPRVAGFNESGS
jgi:transposase